MLNEQVVSQLPPLPHRYRSDLCLQQLLQRYLSFPALEWAIPRLEVMGEAAAEMLEPLSDLANKNPPRLHPRDRFGNRIDSLEFHPAYRELQRFAYSQGMISHYYDPQVREQVGVGLEAIKFAQGYLFAQAEQGLYCPICMTDGSAYLIENYGSQDQQQRFLPQLTSNRLEALWEGAMFLTEKAGGSDVGASQTLARPDGPGYRLFGEKWFCSNAGAEVAMVLARPQHAPPGTAGLGLFVMRRHQDNGELNSLSLHRLKDKLGTRSMPTGEYTLEGSWAESIGDLSRGFLQMTDMLNLSRLYNATASTAIMRRVTSEAIRYASVRKSFGRVLLSNPMIQQALVDSILDQEAALHLLFHLYDCRARARLAQALPEQLQQLRVLTPLAKLVTGRQAVRAASEAIELHGGNGYIEDWPLARFFRDAQVLPIWEGTTNILALDTLRCIRKEGCQEALLHFVETESGQGELKKAGRELRSHLKKLLAQPGQADTINWCWRATLAFQATLMIKACRDSRSQNVAELFLARHFHPDRKALRPGYYELGQRCFQELIQADV